MPIPPHRSIFIRQIKIEVPKQRTPSPRPNEVIKLSGASGHNLQNVDLTIPLGIMTCVTGVSGSGKSTLINRTLLPLAATQLNGATTLTAEKFDSLMALQHLDKVVDIDQSPIGRTPRSNPATYTGLFTRSVNCLPKLLKPKHAVIAQVVFV